jgi:hypothetical protein
VTAGGGVLIGEGCWIAGGATAGIVVFGPTCGGIIAGLGVTPGGGGAAGVGVGFPVRFAGLTETFWWCSHANVTTNDASRAAAANPPNCIRRRLTRDRFSSSPLC